MAAVFSAAANAQDVPGDARERTFGNGQLPEFLAIYDENKDGRLSEEELQVFRDHRRDRRDEVKSRWDTDGDGTLSDDEAAAAREAIHRQLMQNRSLRFEEADRNGDGFLTPAEFFAIPAVARLDAERARAVFDRLDHNDDRMISLEEFLRHFLNRPKAVSPAPGETRPPRTDDRLGDERTFDGR